MQGLSKADLLLAKLQLEGFLNIVFAGMKRESCWNPRCWSMWTFYRHFLGDLTKVVDKSSTILLADWVRASHVPKLESWFQFGPAAVHAWSCGRKHDAPLSCMM